MSQDGLLLSSQCERQPSHLEVTEWDLYQPALDILAVVLYTFIGRRRRRRRRRRSSEGRGKTKRNSGFCLVHFYEKLGANVIGQPTCRSGPHSYRISLVSITGNERARKCARACIEGQLYTRANKSLHTQTCLRTNEISPCTHKHANRSHIKHTILPSLFLPHTHTHTHTHTLQRGSGSNQIAALQSPSESCFPASLHPCTSGSSPALQ